jgi:hypothetical protein
VKNHNRTELTDDQIKFLEHHNISANQVFNAIGLGPSEYRSLMKELNKEIAFNVSPCRKSGHNLRTRSGHCVQCFPAAIEFQRRATSGGIIYVAGSKKGRILKFGYSKSNTLRESSLNRTYYANQNDWKVLLMIESEMAGRIEIEFHNQYREHQNPIQYNHNGYLTIASESYSLNYSEIRDIIREMSFKMDNNANVILDRESKDYEFRNTPIEVVKERYYYGKKQENHQEPPEWGQIAELSILKDISRIISRISL